MDLDTQNREAQQQLRDALSKLTAIEPAGLARTSELGTSLDFSAGIPVFSRTLRLFRDLAEANLDNIPATVLNQLKQATDQAQQSIAQITEFDPSRQSNPATARDGLIQQLASQYDSHFQQISPVIAYSVRKGTDFDLLEQQARAALTEVGELRTSLKKEGEQIIRDARAALAEVQRAAAEVGVAQHAIHFKQEAHGHSRARWKWLVATTVLAIAILSYGGFNVYYYMTHTLDIPTAQLVQLSIAKLVVFGGLYFALIWAGRMYRAESHNWVINQHRQNALSTFETFVKAASDDQTKSAVLLQATQSIFSHQPSGFSQHEQDAVQSPQVLEIIRNMMPGRSDQ